MLAGTSSDTGTSLYDTVDLTFSLSLTMFFIIIFYVTKCSLICQCSYGSGTECLSCTEDNLGIFVRITLVIPGEVKVDIRLFISLESKECLEWNIESVLRKLLSADRTDTDRLMPSAASGKFLFIF